MAIQKNNSMGCVMQPWGWWWHVMVCSGCRGTLCVGWESNMHRHRAIFWKSFNLLCFGAHAQARYTVVCLYVPPCYYDTGKGKTHNYSMKILQYVYRIMGLRYKVLRFDDFFPKITKSTVEATSFLYNIVATPETPNNKTSQVGWNDSLAKYTRYTVRYRPLALGASASCLCLYIS